MNSQRHSSEVSQVYQTLGPKEAKPGGGRESGGINNDPAQGPILNQGRQIR